MRLTGLLLVALAAWGQAAAPAAKRRVRALPGEALELKTKDGWSLSAVYFPAKPERATVVLLHSFDGRKENWLPLTRALAKAGFGYLALDLRGHGASQTPPEGGEGQWWKFKIPRAPGENNEWANMGLDVEAAVEALKAKLVDEKTVALGGADVGSSVALRYAAAHKEVPLIFMLSPGLRYKEVLTYNAMRAYGPRPMLIAVGQDDKSTALAETGLLYQAAKLSAGEQNVVLANVDHEHGTKMLLRNKGLVERVVDWLEHPGQPSGVSILSVSTDAAPGEAPGPADPDKDLFPAENPDDSLKAE